MNVQRIDPQEANRRLKAGATLIDVREANEHAREHIPGARLAPLSCFDAKALNGDCAVFYCQSGRRTLANAERLSAAGFREICVLDGGLAAWKEAGFATDLDRSKPIELQRQVQIAAGSLVLLGLLSAVLVSPWFALLSAFVGAGLVFAGVTGWCGMAHLLAVLPWNRQ